MSGHLDTLRELVEAANLAGGGEEGVGVVEPLAAQHRPLAQPPQVGAVEALLGRRLDGHAGRVGGGRWTLQPDPRVGRHAGLRHDLQRRGDLGGRVDLPRHPGHHIGDLHLPGELRLDAPQLRLGTPRPRTQRIGEIRDVNHEAGQ